MPIIQHHISLQDYNTFGIAVKATLFTEVTNEEELVQALQINSDTYKKPVFLISGGSNMLLTKDVDAFVIHNKMKGITVNSVGSNAVEITAMGGENWHEFVLFCIENNYGGLENLSLIPGSVGSAPIQNIGAYGVEIKDTFVSCEAIAISSGERSVFTKEECQFDYRSSIFKTTHKGAYFITKVTFRLTKNQHQLQTSYGAITKQLEANGVQNPTLKEVSDAVIAIRNSKLPDPKILGNSGSFFKNPIITNAAFEQLKNAYPEVPSYQINQNTVKVPAGWLIEKSGFKGQRFGDAGVHKSQALVLVNYGKATGNEILDLSKKIQEKVKQQFGIELEAEVNLF